MTTEPNKIALATETPSIEKLWSTITTGSHVLAPEFDENGDFDGWWEAVVIEAKGGQFTLEWRDFPEQGKFARTLTQMAIMHPKLKV